MRITSRWTGIAVAVAALVVGAGAPAQAIVGGTEVTGEKFRQSWSSTVSLMTRLPAEADRVPVIRCGGTYIGDRWVLTAAHCLVHPETAKVMSPTDVSIRAGSAQRDSGGVVLTADRVHVHLGFDHKQKNDDIALVRLSSDAGLADAGVRPARLVNNGWNYSPGVSGNIAGWGLTEADSPSLALRSVPLKLWPQEICGQAMRSAFKVTESMVCAGPHNLTRIQGAGQGDSGGPLLVDIDETSTVVGVFSWGGFAVSGPRRTANANFPTGFTRVGKYIPWIESVRDDGAAQRRAVRTIAGDGGPDFRGDNEAATAAQLRYPGGVTVDAKGDIIIADTLNHRIRRVNAHGVITTLAGDGRQGFSGDRRGPAIDAQLSSPMGVTVDSKGNIIFADTGNHRIRRIDPNGTITTIAGNGTAGLSGDGRPATDAQLNTPMAVTVDAKGDIIIADTRNHRIRRIGPNGIITTVAGTDRPVTISFGGDGRPATAAQLNTPSGVAADVNGNIIIADTLNNRIRQISPAGTITTIAGNGEPGFDDDGKPGGFQRWLRIS
ncbi:MAG: trypsin-like serine protease [Longispora sp.]|nr:trypsin-like serine protease [Longispora sp. (in: high G+C Gram-positive bacteria)]